MESGPLSNSYPRTSGLLVAGSLYNQIGLVDTAKYLRPSGPKYKTYKEGKGKGIGIITSLQVIGNPNIITIVPNGVGIEINGL